MKIQIKDLSNNGEVFVWGLCGPHYIEKMLSKINEDIEKVNSSLRSLYE